MSQEATRDHEWKVLKHGLKWEHADIHQLNETELLIVHHLDPSGSTNIKSLWKYNFHDNKWMKWYDYPTNIHCKWSTSALNDNKTKLYIFGDPGFVVSVNLKNGMFQKSHQRFHDGAHSKSIFHEGQFHIFGGWDAKDRSHFIWNETEQSLSKIHFFEEITELNAFSLMYLPLQQSVLILNDKSGLYSYSFITNKCVKMDIKLDIDVLLSLDEAVLTKDDRYVIMFMDGETDITVFDLEKQQIGKSNVSLPCDSDQYLLIRNDNYKQQYLTFGFIRKHKTGHVPNDIITMIMEFVYFEIIHILNDNGHWSMDVEIIINNTFWNINTMTVTFNTQ